ncbi:helix-turn-helix domain-containing protein [Nocardia vinacea]
MSSVARLLGVSRSTIYKYLPDLTETRTAVAMQATPDPVASAPLTL